MMTDQEWIDLPAALAEFPVVPADGIFGALDGEVWHVVRGVSWARDDARISAGAGAKIHRTVQLHDASRIGVRAIVSERVTFDGEVRVGDDTAIYPLCVISSGVQIGAGVFVGREVTLGARVHVDARVRLHSNVHVGPYSQIGTKTSVGGHTRVGTNVRIGALVTIGAHVTVGFSCSIGEVARIGNFVSMPRHTDLGSGAVVANFGYDPVDIGFADGYRKVVAGYPPDDGTDRLRARITAGCRYFRLSEAHYHWSTAHEHDRGLTRALLASAEAVALYKGWILD